MRKDNKIKGVSMSSIDLTSVGSTLTSNLEVFPIDCSEAPESASEAEEMMGVHLYDVDGEWFSSMSSDDLKSFFKFIENTTHLIADVYVDWKTKIWSMWEESNNCFMNLEDPTTQQSAFVSVIMGVMTGVYGIYLGRESRGGK